MNTFPLFGERDRLCSKCRLHLAEPMAWLCQTCDEELEGKWKRATGHIEPDPLEPIKIPTGFNPFSGRSVVEPFVFRE